MNCRSRWESKRRYARDINMSSTPAPLHALDTVRPFRLNPSGRCDTQYLRVNWMTTERIDEVPGIACQEVRGGNHLAAYSVGAARIDRLGSCHPLQPSSRGGDVYYMSACSAGVIARVVLADMAGHGETVSLAADRLRDALLTPSGSVGPIHLDPGIERQLPEVLTGIPALQRLSSPATTPNRESCCLRTPGMCLRCGIVHAAGVEPLVGLDASQQRDCGPAPGLDRGHFLHPDSDTTGSRRSPAALHGRDQRGLRRIRARSWGWNACSPSRGSLPTESAVAAGKGLIAAVAGFRGTAPSVDDEPCWLCNGAIRM